MHSEYKRYSTNRNLTRLTAEGDDAHGVQFVLGANVRAHADDEDVAEAGGGRHHPDEDPQHDVGQQILEGRDAVGVRLAAAHVRSIAAVLELLEVAVKGDTVGASC